MSNRCGSTRGTSSATYGSNRKCYPCSICLTRVCCYCWNSTQASICWWSIGSTTGDHIASQNHPRNQTLCRCLKRCSSCFNSSAAQTHQHDRRQDTDDRDDDQKFDKGESFFCFYHSTPPSVSPRNRFMFSQAFYFSLVYQTFQKSTICIM